MPVEKEKFHLGKYKFQFGSGGGQGPGFRGRAPGGGLGLSSWIFQFGQEKFCHGSAHLGGFSTGMVLNYDVCITV